MIHYHGTPITPSTAALRVLNAGHAFVSFQRPEQLGLAIEVSQTFAVDNGAFSAWRSGNPITDWRPFYEWVAELHRYPSFDFAVIPDVIDGDEAANDALLEEWPWRENAPWVGAPVWHLHESLERLERLAFAWPRICLGSSGEFAAVGSQAWYVRMAEAMDVLCDKSGRPICKIHGLRMLDPDVFTRFPFASADSTNIGQNVGIDSKWRGPYTPATKESRAQVMRERIEAHQSPAFWVRELAPVQKGFELEFA
jgi:hypothetical protein